MLEGYTSRTVTYIRDLQFERVSDHILRPHGRLYSGSTSFIAAIAEDSGQRNDRNEEVFISYLVDGTKMIVDNMEATDIYCL